MKDVRKLFGKKEAFTLFVKSCVHGEKIRFSFVNNNKILTFMRLLKQYLKSKILNYYRKKCLLFYYSLNILENFNNQNPDKKEI